MRRPSLLLTLLSTASATRSSSLTAEDTVWRLAATDPVIHWAGRHQATAENTQRFDWPCTSFTVASAGSTSVVVEMNGGGSRFAVIGCGDKRAVFDTSHGLRNYTVCSSAGFSSVQVRKVTEAGAMWGPIVKVLMPQSVAELHAIFITGSKRPTPVSPVKRRIQVFGDSDSAGFGVEGPDKIHGLSSLAAADCARHAVRYENCDGGYDAMLGRMLGAEISVVAWSGRGLVQNAEAALSGSPVMPFYWNKTLGTDPSVIWDFAEWVPDVVVVYLGANDYIWNPQSHQPSNATFVQGYFSLLRMILVAYPDTEIVSLCGGGNRGNQKPCPHVQSAAEMAPTHVAGAMNRSHYIEIPEMLINETDWGCWNHRNLDGQSKIAQFVAPRISSIMGW